MSARISAIYISSDSEIESLSKNKHIKSEKPCDDKIKIEKDDSEKKEENVKENVKEKEIKDSEKGDKKKNEISYEKSNGKNREKEDKTEKKEEDEEKEKEKEIKIELNENFNNTKNIDSINYYAKKVKINKGDILPSYDFIELKNSDDILYGEETLKIYDCKNKKRKK